MAKIKVKKDKVTFWLSIINLVLVLISLVAVVQLSTKVANIQTAPTQGNNADQPDQQAPSAVKVDVGVNPARGNKNAKVVLIEFSDFECPFCSRVVPTMDQIEKTYGDKVAIYFRNFPLPFHSSAQKAAEAGQCANEQGKFWEMHDEMFANQDALSVDNLKSYAKGLGLDTTKFNDCLDSGKMAQVVQNDLNAGRAAGVSGTPTTFVNGKAIVGAYPFEAFQQAIDAELAK